MYILRSDVTVFWDCDDTLIKWIPGTTNWEPHKRHIRELKKFYNRGQPVVVWSAGGYEHALNIVKKLKLEQFVSVVMAKPRWWADDCAADDVLPQHSRIFFQDDEE